MKRFLLLFVCLGLTLNINAQNKYNVKINLINIVDDKVFVEILIPKIKHEKAEFQFPNIIPGDYNENNFGRFISNVKALDNKGKELDVIRINNNRWEIPKSNKLAKITYWVDDSRDNEIKPSVFEPSGTNIDKGIFTINFHGFVGFIAGVNDVSYEVEIIHPEHMYGSTSLEDKNESKVMDRFIVSRYAELIDNPIMYCKPDTARSFINNFEILYSVYSPSETHTAQYVKSYLDEMFKAQVNYLGDLLQTNKYTSLFYHSDEPLASDFGWGALEHSYSNLSSFPDKTVSPEMLKDMMLGVISHEFFHTIMPINCHSEEIHNFNYINPNMSKHLWFYEGVVDYFSDIFQVKEDLVTRNEFLRIIQGEMFEADKYVGEVSFTEFSKNVLDNHETYMRVYNEGALIGMCLDLQLLFLSEGKYGVRDLVEDLLKVYNENMPFKDDDFFDIITKMTYPEVREFFAKYVENNNPLPIKEYLQKVGVEYEESVNDTIMDYLKKGRFAVNPETNHLVIVYGDDISEFGSELGIKENDEIVEINGVEVTTENYGEVYARFKEMKEGDLFMIKIARFDEGQNRIEKEMSGKLRAEIIQRRHLIKYIDNPNSQQVKLQNAWLSVQN